MIQLPPEIEKLILKGKAYLKVVTHVSSAFTIRPPKNGYLIMVGFETFAPVVPALQLQDPDVTAVNFNIRVNFDYGSNFYQGVTNGNIDVGENDALSGKFLNQVPKHSFLCYGVTDQPVVFDQRVALNKDQVDSVNLSNYTLNRFPPFDRDNDYFDTGGGNADFVSVLVATSNTSQGGVGLRYLPFGPDDTSKLFGVSTGDYADSFSVAFNKYARPEALLRLSVPQTSVVKPGALFNTTVYYAVVDGKKPDSVI